MLGLEVRLKGRPTAQRRRPSLPPPDGLTSLASASRKSAPFTMSYRSKTLQVRQEILRGRSAS